VRCTAAMIVAHNAEHGTARGGMPCRGASIVGEDKAVPNSTIAEVMEEQGEDGGQQGSRRCCAR
jgi:hypothetical protein